MRLHDVGQFDISYIFFADYRYAYKNIKFSAFIDHLFGLHHCQVIQKLGGTLADSYLDEGFLLDKRPGVNQPKRVENARILIANTSMDADKIKIFGSKIRVDAISKVAALELAEREKMKEKVAKIVKHNCNVFINR